MFETLCTHAHMFLFRFNELSVEIKFYPFYPMDEFSLFPPEPVREDGWMN